MRLQASMRLQVSPVEFFQDGEYLLADSGFQCTTVIIPMYKCASGELDLPGRQLYFNDKCVTACVTIEYAFGILKGCWQFLRGAKMQVKTKEDEARVYGMIQAAFILHNLTVSTASDYVSNEDLQRQRGTERREKNQLLVGQRGHAGLKEDYIRRERLVEEMLEYEIDEYIF
ncbi:hypothetical protein TREMEDRAFT_66536 [Tremella mesenterica DSM 1558]|uniref:uncharacterized protein n=1 Tax=Tremella mesenterica (strain ATCC 24925 / CBS 8224 / DSM 1558 / NBRC 9311 / NRRL Y-6157 / RJB 2259-6 / UBC 559-6) TaxID=578456 RepID=UPI00032D0BB7|nr:uncharacterized protein TREMEDRAFT_66536 [Tremella mesenterica DSM 1558]EIW65470.1 hypothetical protein TREMEDRAFT_66536 [Tremella mesenterica DSM 1558]